MIWTEAGQASIGLKLRQARAVFLTTSEGATLS